MLKNHAKLAASEQQQRDEQAHIAAVQALLPAGEVDALALLTAKLDNALVERTRPDVLVESQQSLALLEDTLRYPLALHTVCRQYQVCRLGKAIAKSNMNAGCVGFRIQFNLRAAYIC